MQKNVIQEILNRLGIDWTLQHAQTLTSAVTTAWGVDWDEAYIARDLMQNFFDANRQRVEEVLVQNKGSDVVITAPTPFNLKRLFYLGSEKGDGDVGQYGEGFKAAAVCLLRDHAVTPIAASGWDVVVLRIAGPVDGTRLHPVEYDFYRNNREVQNTVLMLPGCSEKLVKALAEGLTHFFHDKNPLLGAKRWSTYRDEFSLYDSTNGHGHVFYRKLKRGEIDGIPVVLVIDKQYQALEKKISKDRDRNAFGEEVMKLFYNHFFRYGLNYHHKGQEVIVRAAKACWEKGHPLLSEMATETRRQSWPSKLTHEVFGNKYYALSGHSSDSGKQLEIDRLERLWREEGKLRLYGYFRWFGVSHAEDEIHRIQDKATEESKRNNQRKPTTAEHNAIQLLSRVLGELAPEVIAVFTKGTTHYTVAKTEVVLGQLRRDRSYRSREIFLAESVFISDFPNALATFLHEHAHIFGHDGSRGFTDALTELLETVVRHRHALNQYEDDWKNAKILVQAERTESGARGEAKDSDDWLSAMDANELREIVAQHMPAVVLKRLRDNRA